MIHNKTNEFVNQAATCRYGCKMAGNTLHQQFCAADMLGRPGQGSTTRKVDSIFIDTAENQRKPETMHLTMS